MQISHLRVTAECEECDNSVINDKSHTGIAQTWLQENLWNKYVKRIIRSAYDAGISDKFLDHIHITDKIVNNLFQVFAGFVRRFTVGAAQHIIHKISVKTTAGCRLYGIVISVQFPIRASFLFLRCKNEGKLLRGDVKEVTIVCRLVGFDAVENKWIEY